jgi:NADH-quinone oxidoreductase subunit E
MSEYTELIAPFKHTPGGILEALHAVQEKYREISPKALREAAAAFHMTEAEVYGIATFYTYFSFYQQGRYIIRVCRSAPCHIQGAEQVLRQLEKLLGIPIGATTEDGKFTLTWSECVGQCQQAPVITWNTEIASLSDIECRILQVQGEEHVT